MTPDLAALEALTDAVAAERDAIIATAERLALAHHHLTQAGALLRPAAAPADAARLAEEEERLRAIGLDYGVRVGPARGGYRRVVIATPIAATLEGDGW